MERDQDDPALKMPDEMPLHARFESMRLGLMRSYYYYEMRLTFWSAFMFIAAAINAVLSLSAICALYDNTAVWVRWLVAISAFMTFVLTWFGANKRANCLTAQKLATKQVQNMLPASEAEEVSGGEALYKKVKTAREDFELRDDIILECADAICHNKACVTLGIPQRYVLAWWQRYLGRLLPIPYTERSCLQRVDVT